MADDDGDSAHAGHATSPRVATVRRDLLTARTIYDDTDATPERTRDGLGMMILWVDELVREVNQPVFYLTCIADGCSCAGCARAC